jgi:hypothetical protein
MLPVVAFSGQSAAELVQYVDTLPITQWFHRLKINSKPTKGDPTADYWFMGDRQMPKELYAHLLALAPTIDGAKPEEICLNRYEVGNGMPEHVDIAMYRYNMVIPLSDHGDGLLVEGVFHADKPGQGVIMPFKSPPHEVPPVKHRRYTLIYLYE